MDNKRLIVWMVVTLGAIFVLSQLRALFFPPPPPQAASTAPAREEPKADAKPRPLSPQELATGQAGVLRGLVPAAPPFLAELLLDDVKQLALKLELARQLRAQQLAQLPPDRVLTLGDQVHTKLLVNLSQRHAAVKNIVLLKHTKATKEYGDRVEGQPLTLISDTEDIKGSGEEKQSFRLLVGKEPLEWQVESATAEKVVFVAEVPGKPLRVRKIFTLQPQVYHVDLAITFEATASTEATYELTGPRGLPVEAMKWRQLPFRNLVTCVTKPGEPNKPIRFLDDHARLVKGDVPTARNLTEAGNPTNLVYAGVMLSYFSALIVVDRTPGQEPPALIDQVQYEDLGNDKEAAPFQAAAQGRVSLRLASRPFKIDPKQPVTHKYLLYAGPTKPLLLNYEPDTEEGLADKYIGVYHLNTQTDYPWFGWTGALGLTTIFVFFTNLMHRLLENLHWLFGSYGVAIIVMTAFVRMLMHPISRKQLQSSQDMAAKMAKLKPEMAKMQEKFKNDPQAKSMAQWELMKKHGVNPFSSCTGCLVVFIQMPIFMGLYYALNESMHLRLSSFLWMPNLAAPDMLVFWGNWPVMGWLSKGFQLPVLGSWFHLGDFLHILPLISVTLMYIHQKKVAPPAMDDQQAMQMKMMNYMMFFFAYMFYWVPSGLCLYFIVSSGWGLLERRFMPKKKDETKDVVETISLKDGRKETKAGKEVKAPEPTGLMARIRGWWEKALKEADKRR